MIHCPLGYVDNFYTIKGIRAPIVFFTKNIITKKTQRKINDHNKQQIQNKSN